MKVATSDTADTLTFIFGRSSIGNPAGQPVGDLTVATKPYTDGASGKPIKMDGDRVIQVRFMHMSLQNDAGQETYQGPASVEARPARRSARRPCTTPSRARWATTSASTDRAASRSSGSARTLVLTFAH